MLTFRSATLLNRPSEELLAADLDDDARDFYDRAASDIAIVVNAMAHAPDASEVARILLTALVATPPVNEACWRRLYVKISGLVARCDTVTFAENARRDHLPALGRLRQFLSDNADLADARAVQDAEDLSVSGALVAARAPQRECFEGR